ncbi:hypothetical protein [Paenibacillus sp. sgz500958]|uniref:hypothetical protein n=1 Tax=Paenibacillus sp. sgz500958 TaxID=3242475 RepID=UPI0036D33C3B
MLTRLKVLMSGLLALILTGVFLAGIASADWAYAFVVYNGNSYVISEVQVDPGQIGSSIGTVTRYSDEEGTYSGNFSNKYPKGTKYYAINNIEVKESIAVKESGNVYIRADFQGEYAGAGLNPAVLWGLLAVVLVLAVVTERIFTWRKARKRD